VNKTFVSIGIDLGFKGAIAAINRVTGLSITVWDMPTFKIKKQLKRGKTKTITEYDICKIRDIIEEIARLYSCEEVVGYVEKALILPNGYNIKTNIKMGGCQKIFESLFAASRIRNVLVEPKEWQEHFGITGKKGDTGEQSIKIASEMFPLVKFKTPKGRLLDGRADALLIAEYGKILNDKEITNVEG
jgi:hypothetical protein